MKTRYFPSNCFQIVPIQGADQPEVNERKRVISELVKMNEGFLEKGAGRKVVNPNTGEQEYRDVPHFSLKLLKRDGKIHVFANMPKDKDRLIENKIRNALYEDIGELRIKEDHLELPEKNLYTFAVKGGHLAIDLETNNKMKEVFRFADNVMYSLTVKEVESHEDKRDQLEKELLGLADLKSKLWHYTKTSMKITAKILYDFWYDGEDEKKAKHQVALKQIKNLLPKKEHTFTNRKLSSEKNRYMLVEILFLLWTDKEKKAQRFKAALQKLMDEMKGENQLEVVEVRPDLANVAKGRIQYDLPTLCLYQAELSKFLLLPNIEDEEFYSERPQKTQIPEMMFVPQPGALAFARDINTDQIVYFPEAKTEEQKDDAVKAIVLVGEQGGGKTTAAINQIVETFHLKAKSREEWQKYAHSVIAFDVADGEMHTDILRHVPDWLMDRVIILNHANLRYPIPTNLHDLAKETYDVSTLAEDECDMLMDCLDDKSTTIAVERYFKNAMKASYEVGEGGLLDAMRILTNDEYRLEIIRRLQPKKKELYIEMIQIHKKLIRDEKMIETIENRITTYRTNRTLMYSIAQPPNDNIDFYKWMNGDKDGPYLVLIYIPSEKAIGKSTRKFLFTHYFYKIWKMMYGRESINKPKRSETLIVVDELHQILDQRVVAEIFPKIFKEPRKYRLRYLFTFHGWSSIEEAGQKKEPIIQSMSDSGCNIFFYKGGVDFFNSMKRLAEPYTWKDFSEIQRQKYCGLFRISHNKESHVFPARFLEPPIDRLEKYREISLSEYHRYQSAFGCAAEFVQQRMDSKLEETYQQLIKEFEEEEKERQQEKEREEKACQNQSASLEEELARITGGNEFPGVN